MAINLPFFSKNNKDELAAQGGAIAQEPGTPEIQSKEENDGVKKTGRDAKRKTESAAKLNPNSTFIGDALQRSGDIRLPLIGHLPLQQQVRILLGSMGTSLLLGTVFVWLNSNISTMT